MNKVLIIIVTYNAMKWVDRCFSSLKESTCPNDVYVVDNGSTDGTQQYIKDNYPEAIFYQSQENLGFGKANNAGLEYAIEKGYDYAYLLNQDAWIYPDTLNVLIQAAHDNPNFGILSPMQMTGSGKRLDKNFVSTCCSYKFNQYLFEDLYFGRVGEVYSVKHVMAAHWLMNLNIIKKVGVFSDTFPHYGEDTNLCHRMCFHNFKVGIVPAAKAVHDREYRIQTKAQAVYQIYILLLLRLSNPLDRESIISLKIWRDIFSAVFRFHSFSIMPYLLKIILKMKTINKNVMLSKSLNGPFLKR